MDRLSVKELGIYGISKEVIACLLTGGMTHLLPLQAEALQRTGLLTGQNLLVLAPTSAGKTFVGELAALRQWQAGRKVVFLTPTRSLTAEQYTHLHTRYGPAGIRTVLSTADHTRHDAAIRRGEFDFAVMVYEKFRSFLVSCSDLLYSLGGVVADELQILYDAERGETADLVLTRIAGAESSVQIIGLSAVMDQAEPVAEWLGAEMLTSAMRPTELREGILCLEHDVYHYPAPGGGSWQDEELPGQNPDRENQSYPESGAHAAVTGVIMAAARLARVGESCLVFVPTRSMSRQVAAAIATELGTQFQDGIRNDGDVSVDTDAGNALQAAEDSVIRRQLHHCLPAGVAFHNSDLTAELRALVERGFNSGSIRVIVATPTLAQGVNLRARNVIQVPLMMRSHSASAFMRPCPEVPLSLERYRNQAGRAGRVGSGEAFGRSILVAQSHLEAVRLARSYVEAQPSRQRRSCAGEGLHHFILDFIDSGTATTFSGIHDALATTFAWRCDGFGDPVKLEHNLAECVRQMLELELIDESSAHRLRLTGLGQAMAAGGFRAETMGEMLAWSRAWKSGALPSELEILLACAVTADGEAFPLAASAGEMKSGHWLRYAQRSLDPEIIQQRDALGRALKPGGGLSRTGHASVKLAVICHEWITDKPTVELEEQLHTVAGTLAAAATHLAWIAGGLAACATIADCDAKIVETIRALGARLPQGLASGATTLARLQVTGLTRNYIHRLVAEGFDTPAAIQEADDAIMFRLLPTPTWLAVRAALGLPEKHTPTTKNTDAAVAPVDYAIPLSCDTALAVAETAPDVPTGEPASDADLPAAGFDLIVDDSNPGTVIFHGRPVQLSPKPYALLGLLARHCGSTVAYSAIDENVWPEEKVEPQQISAHKSRLVSQLARVTTRQTAEGVIATAAGFGLRLTLPPSRVRVNQNRVPGR